MKKKLIGTVCAFVIGASLITGCAVQVPAAGNTSTDAAASEEAAVSGTAEEEGSAVGMANPWVAITEEEAESHCVRLFKIPDGAELIDWMMLEGSESESVVGEPLIQLSFTTDDPEMVFQARAQQGAPEDKDIAGLYVEWAAEDEATLANWGGGHMPAKCFRSVSDTGMVDLITWYDVEIGILYTLSTAAEDLDGFDIRAVAEAMYDPDNEPFTGPDEEETGEMTYMSADGWTVRYDPAVFESYEIDEHTAQFVYLGESAGSNVASISYIEGREPEEYLDEYTAEWGEDTVKVEGIFPGTDETPGFWRMSPAAEEGSGLYETVIAGAYRNGILVLDCIEHKSGDEAADMLVSDMMANVIDSLAYGDYDLQAEYEGLWAEKTSERVVISIASKEEEDLFDVVITWHEALPQKDLYTMTARYQDDGSLYYEDCTHVIRQFADDGSYEDTVQYEDGSGLLWYAADEETLYWTDYTVEDKEERVQTFVRAAFDVDIEKAAENQ